MNSADLRQSFLDFFHEKQHSIVPSASLLPTSPNLLFTNAGMNPFVPIFLGEQTPNASRLPGAKPALDTRAADTQKCIRAGGKHNDLEDVGFDTYHHTLFEMLGNWSFGDYFKKEAISWAWELLTERWGLPKERLYASVYKPGNGDPAEFDQEAYDYWKAIFINAGLDPETHIIYGNKKDNFWMMGDTGPCGPCSEIHIDLTPNGDTQGKLVNTGSPWCIEIWNLVFIQFNANEDGTFKPLTAKHVDTGMGFERVCGIMATSRGFKDFSQTPSNYNSDLFTDLFDFIGKLSGRSYARTLPENPAKLSEQEQSDVVFRILADHIRTLSFSIADGILPGNNGRNYVLRRILRRAVMWGKRIQLPTGFFAQLVDPLIAKMGPVFPELIQQRSLIQKVIANEESAFDKTLDKGLEILDKLIMNGSEISGSSAFTLYDTYGFPLDLTQLIARERGLNVDVEGFNAEMQKQQLRSQAAQKKSVIIAKDATKSEDVPRTEFNGFDISTTEVHTVQVIGVISSSNDDGHVYLLFDSTLFYAEMGGQVGDTGKIVFNEICIKILDTTKDADGRFLHSVAASDRHTAETIVGQTVSLFVDTERRATISRHHTATHILHWALREVLGKHVKQAGSYVGPDRLRFDFSHFEGMTVAQLSEVEKRVNEKILLNEPVRWFEVPYSAKPDDVVAFFGDKYGDEVRIVQIGGDVNLHSENKTPTVKTWRAHLVTRTPGFSSELCGGTHVQATGEIGLFKIVSESAVAAGTRRIEAVCGSVAYTLATRRFQQIYDLSQKLKCSTDELDSRLDALLEKQTALEKELRSIQQKNTTATANDLAANAIEKNGVKWVVAKTEAETPNDLRGMAVHIGKGISGANVVVLGAEFNDKVSILALCNEAALAAGLNAGTIVRDLTGKLGGKGGGKPDLAMGGAPNNGKLAEILQELIK